MTTNQSDRMYSINKKSLIMCNLVMYAKDLSLIKRRVLNNCIQKKEKIK